MSESPLPPSGPRAPDTGAVAGPFGRLGVAGAAAVVTAYALLATTVVVLLVWAGLAPAQRGALANALGGTGVGLLAGGTTALLLGLFALVWLIFGRRAGAVRLLTADTRLIAAANPDHRLAPSPVPELAELGVAIQELAERRSVAEQQVDRLVVEARREVEQERNRLAALMAELTVAVVVCNVAGRILLYNAAARSLLDDDPGLGLGRSVFALVDRGLVTHEMERVAQGGEGPGNEQAHVATVVRGDQLLQVRLATIAGVDAQVTGFLLVLEDMTARLQAGQAREALLRDLTESTRAALGSIRAAIETVVDYPEMAPGERGAFVQIVQDEAERLGQQVERWVADSSSHLVDQSLLMEIAGADLLAVLSKELTRDDALEDLTHTAEPSPADLWLLVDSYALASTVGHLVGRLRTACGVAAVTLSLTRAGRHAQFDARWTGRPPDADVVAAWLDESLQGSALARVRDVLERHGAEAWCGDAGDGTAYLRVLLPLAEGTAASPRRLAPPHDRSPDYDFALFDVAEDSRAWTDRELAALTFTVFDTETTGLDPAVDEIVSIGAVRVVNGRLLRGETFDQLVDPGRPVPARSTAVHGITTAMVAGQGRIGEILPRFSRFAEDTVLVGHNVGFDLRFLREKQHATGALLSQPVLDTLLLDAAVHPDHDEHSLEAIAARLGVEVVDRHTALGDAVVTAEVLLLLVGLLRQRGVRTLGEARALSQETVQASLDRSLYGS